MTLENWYVIGILALSLTLFVLEKPRVDVVALLVLIATVLLGLVSPEAAFAGFASPAVVTVWAVFIVSGGITRTGVADMIGNGMVGLVGDRPRRFLAVMMLTAGVMSAFMNNIGAVAILLPAVMSVCRRLNVAPSRMLIPLAVASLLGGNITLIGTPPNLIAADLMRQEGVSPFGFFDFAPTGLAVLVVGIVYMLTVGRRLLPERTSGAELSAGYALRDYLTEAAVTEQSPLIWKKINRIRFGDEYDVAIVYVRRDEELLQQASDRRLRASDVLLLEGPPEQIRRVSENVGLRLEPNLHEVTLDRELQGAGRLVEISLPPNSKFLGKTLRDLSFRSRYGVTILAIRHEGEPLVNHVVDVPLRFGDVLLAQGAADRIDRLRNNPNLLVLDNRPPDRGQRAHRAPHAIVVALVTLVLIVGGFVDVSTAMVLGGVGMVLVGALSMEEAYQSIDWKSVFLIAGMLPLGDAMKSTGTAQLLADGMINVVGIGNGVAVLLAIFVLGTLLTSVISNAAAAVLLVPIAIDAAQAIDANPQPFVMATVIAASSAFLLPIGHQANIIIYGPGGYRFFDFFRVGVWLNLLLLLVVGLLVPLIWPLY